jgi:beta-lactamase class A/predicted RNase H-like HicB family nuclease
MRTLLLLLLIVIVIAAFLLGPSAYAFYQRQGPLPGGVTLGGLPPQGETLEEVARNLQESLQQPVAVYYDNQRTILRPSDVDFEVDVNAMVAEAIPYGEGIGFWRPFLNEVFELPAQPVEVPLKMTFDQQKLAAWLDEVAQQYDTAARPAYGVTLAPGAPFTSTFMFQAGQPGLELEPTLSAQRIVQALSSPTDRQANLVLVEVPPPPPSIKELEKLLTARSDRFPGYVSLFIRQVGGDEEAVIDPDIAFAGMSVLKIPIAVELYRSVLDGPPDIETTKLVTSSFELSSNFAANLMLRLIGGGNVGDEWQGAIKMTETLQGLGLQNTFMASPYDTDRQVRNYTTPANSDKTWDTLPDSQRQTTAKDIGLMLEWVVQCSQGGGTLLAAFPDQLTPGECQQILDAIALNINHFLLESGVPPGTRYAHKHGFVSSAHGDAGVFWGPAGPYIVSLFIYRPNWMEWELSNSLMADVSKAAWDYFTLVANGGQPPAVDTSLPDAASPITSTVPPPEDAP